MKALTFRLIVLGCLALDAGRELDAANAPILLPVANDPTVSFRLWFKVGAEDDPVRAQARVAAAEAPEVVDARHLEPDEVDGVVRDALRVRLGEANAHLGGEAEVHGANSLRSAPVSADALADLIRRRQPCVVLTGAGVSTSGLAGSGAAGRSAGGTGRSWAGGAGAATVGVGAPPLTRNTWVPWTRPSRREKRLSWRRPRRSTRIR